MESYQIDFTMHRGHEMVLQHPRGITRDELEEVELQMLMAGEIPRMLPVEWFELDGKISFHYKLSGKRMLTQRLSLRPFSMSDYYKLVLAVVEGLEDCRLYMLRPESVLLHENYMYIGEQWEDIAFTYVPLRKAAVPGSVTDALQAMAVRWTIHIEQVDGSGLQKLFRALNETGAALPSVRNLLLELLSKPYRPYGAIQPKEVNGSADIQSLAEHKDEPENFSERQPDERSTSDEDHWISSYVETRRDGNEDVPLTEKTPRIKWYIGALLLVLIAAAWRYGYFDSPSPASAAVSAGISLLLIGAGFVSVRKLAGTLEKSAGKYDQNRLMSGMRKFEGHRQEQAESGASKGDRWGRMDPELEMPDSQLLYGSHADLSCSSSLGERQDATVMLGRKEASDEAAEGGMYGTLCLERTGRNGQTDRIRLNQGKTVIGRACESADYVDCEEGLSRSHIEIGYEKGTVSARDLGSRNGSLLNGQVMVPYKVYSLEKGDKLQLAGRGGPVYQLRSDRLDISPSIHSG